MNWIRRLITLPKARNSIKDLLGHDTWQQVEHAFDDGAHFMRACIAWLVDHPDKASEFARSLLLFMEENLIFLQQGVTTTDPFYNVRANTRRFCKRWGIPWNR